MFAPIWAAAAVSGTGAVPANDQIFHWYPFLAPFHAVVLHLPIGFLTIAFILEIYRMIRPSEELNRVVRLVIWVSLLSGIVTASLGILRAQGGGYEAHAVEWHRWSGIAVPACTLLTLVVQGRAYRGRSGLTTFAYRLSLLGTLFLLVVAGHLGGNLTHGAGYLVENAPAFLRDLLERTRPAVPVQAAAPQPQGGVYAEKVAPVLKAKCYQCHGPEKQKGGYRLDQPELAMKGGESGKPGIVPGDVLGSNLARMILLPPDHDDVMPPSGKESLKSEELISVIEWIRGGAVFGPEPKPSPR